MSSNGSNLIPLLTTLHGIGVGCGVFLASVVEDIQYNNLLNPSDELSAKLTKFALPIIQYSQIIYSFFRFRNTLYVIKPEFMKSINVLSQKILVFSIPVTYGLLYCFNSKRVQDKDSIFKKIELNALLSLLNIISGVAIIFFSKSPSKIHECIITIPSVCLLARKIYLFYQPKETRP